MGFGDLPPREIIDTTIEALRSKGYHTYLVENGEEAKAKAMEIIPTHIEIMNATSQTLSSIGMVDEILKTDRYHPVRKMWESMDDRVKDIHRLEAVADWMIGSVHALTQDGKLMIASRTGSQLAGYAYGAFHMLWVIGAQKIVKDLDEGFRRIFEYTLPLEEARAREAYGTGSSVGKMLILYREAVEGRVNIIVVNEVLGF
jgi:LUD domain